MTFYNKGDSSKVQKHKKKKDKKNSNSLKASHCRRQQNEKEDLSPMKEIEHSLEEFSRGEKTWFEIIEEENVQYGEGSVRNSEVTLNLKRKEAESLLAQAVGNFEAKKKAHQTSDDAYLKTMLKSGTLADRAAAMTLSIQKDPLYSLKTLGVLIGMAKKKGRRESQLAIESLKDLFLNNLLPDRKLLYFHQHSLSGAKPSYLLLWYYEHCIKTAFGQLVAVLERGASDSIAFFKRMCMVSSYDLLCSKPEQEDVLLSLIVNKLGDPDKKIATKAHPVMKAIVATEVQKLLGRSNVSEKSQYNAIIFLNQLRLTSSEDDSALASRLIRLYFNLFSKSIDSKNKFQGMERRLLSALLTGVNRALPFSPCKPEELKDDIDMMYRVVHQGNFSTAVQALMLLYQVMDAATFSDRYYTALYTLLLDPKIRETTKHTMFLNLIYRTLKSDNLDSRCLAFIKRLLQVATTMPPSFAASSLYLISQIFQDKPQLRVIVDEKENGKVVDDASKEESNVYDSRKRNPTFSKAENSCLWEISSLMRHYHPSVQSFATSILQGGINYSGDPLVDFTLIAFLDRFAYRNAKQKDIPKRLMYNSRGSSSLTMELPVNSSAFLQQDESSIDDTDKFFYKYFTEREKRNPKAKKKKDNLDGILDQDGEDNDLEAEEEFANKLAEGLLDDDFYDDDDPDTTGWSEDDSDDDGVDDKDDENSDAGFDDKDDEDSDADDIDSLDMQSSEDDNCELDDEGQLGSLDMQDCDEDPVETVSVEKKGRKSPWADASDYDDIMKAAVKSQKKRRIKS